MNGLGDPARETALASTFLALTDTLVQEFDVNDLFDRLVRACVDVLGATTAGLMLADRQGALQLVASSDSAMRSLELFEMRHDQGPCLDSFATGVPIAVSLHDPEAARRWPAFAAEAIRGSITGVRALPMRLRGSTIGALNIFHSGGQDMTPRDNDMAQALADVATIAILQRRALADTETLADQLQAALNERVVIEQAKGLLAERGHTTVDEAFHLLRSFCRSGRLPLTATAGEFVAGLRDPDDVLAGRWPDSL